MIKKHALLTALCAFSVFLCAGQVFAADEPKPEERTNYVLKGEWNAEALEKASAENQNPVNQPSEPKQVQVPPQQAQEPVQAPASQETPQMQPAAYQGQAFSPSAAREKGSYPIHVGDKLKITVQGEKDLSDVYTVDLKGDIRFPLIEKIRAEGLSLSDFRDNLRDELGRNYLNNPQVEVSFQESVYNSILVLGRVNNPGTYTLPPDATFLRGISLAGGLAPDAAYGTSKVMRLGGNGKNISIPVNVEAILNGESPDIVLAPGDTLFVPKIVNVSEEKDDYLNSVAVMGQVAKPGNYKITAGMTLIRILSQAGGLVRGADSGKVTINRKPKGDEQDTRIVDVKKILDGFDQDFMLEAGDVIYVPGARTDVNDIVNLSEAVTILGQVAKPSNYDLVPGLNLIQLISQAGGFTSVANPRRVRITRTTADLDKKVFEVNAAAIINGSEDNIALEKGDIIFVPESVF